MEPRDHQSYRLPVAKPKAVQIDEFTYRVMHVREGGMGKVWIVERDNASPGESIYTRRIAVKTFGSGADDRSIHQELNCWISLQHDCILPLRKIGRLEYRTAAIMPWLPTSLEDLLEERGALDETTALMMLLATARALAYAWGEHQMLHLDIKPSNILLDPGSRRPIQVADWGISRIARVERTLAKGAPSASLADLKTAYSAGTPLFMSPERFSGRWQLLPAADIYSLGMTGLYLVCGVLPFRFGQIDPYDEISSGTYWDNASALLQSSSVRFRELVLSCLRSNPSERPQAHETVLQLIARAMK